MKTPTKKKGNKKAAFGRPATQHELPYSTPRQRTTQIRCTRATIADMREMRQLIMRWYAAQPTHRNTANFYQFAPNSDLIKFAVTECGLSLLAKIAAQENATETPCSNSSPVELNNPASQPPKKKRGQRKTKSTGKR
jgi:hypothetical protein